MFILDTDTLSLLLRAHAGVTERVAQATEEVVITLITRIEIIQGRFDFVLKSESGEKLLQAQQRLDEGEKDLTRFTVLCIDPEAAAEFDRLRQDKKPKKIGRGDLLIAALTLANRATLVTRNGKISTECQALRSRTGQIEGEQILGVHRETGRVGGESRRSVIVVRGLSDYWPPARAAVDFGRLRAVA